MTQDFSNIETPRLTLRRFRAQDKPAFTAYRNDPGVARYQSWEAFTEEEANALIQGMETLPFGLPGQGLQIAVEERSSGGLIGDCYLQVEAHDTRQAEIGFTLSSRHQGKGFASEALLALLSDAFVRLDLHRIAAVTDSRNSPAAALLERLGFRREGHFLQNIWFKGAWGDEYLYAVLREEWLVANSVSHQCDA